MTYAEVTQFGNSEQIHFLESADPVVSDGQLLIEIQSAGINFSDIMARLGVYPDIPRPPFRPGFEVAGRVTSIGKGVKGFSVGDGVAAIMLAGGGYATHAVVDANTAIKLPPGLDFDLAAGLMVQEEIYYPKFGFGFGRQSFFELTKGFEGALEFVLHDYDNLKIIPAGDYVFVEGTSRGKLSGKTWTGGDTPGGRFCNVFKFRGDRLSSVHVYLDPDYTGEDAPRFRWGIDRKW